MCEARLEVSSRGRVRCPGVKGGGRRHSLLQSCKDVTTVPQSGCLSIDPEFRARQSVRENLRVTKLACLFWLSTRDSMMRVEVFRKSRGLQKQAVCHLAVDRSHEIYMFVLSVCRQVLRYFDRLFLCLGIKLHMSQVTFHALDRLATQPGANSPTSFQFSKQSMHL